MPPSWNEFMAELAASDAAEGPEAVAESAILRAHYAFATRVYQGRKKRRMSQQALAKASGIDQAEISRIERGASNPTMATMVRILSAVGLKLDYPAQPRSAGVKRATAPHRRRSVRGSR